MSTYHSSKYQQARKGFSCISCARIIFAGERYLRYRTGLFHASPVCLACSIKVNGDGHLVYWCEAVRQHVGQIATPLGNTYGPR